VPYIILIAGILIGLYALFRFFMKANVRQIRALFLIGALCVVCIASFTLALTGRLPAALAVMGAIIPLAVGYFKDKKKTQKNGLAENSMSRSKALDILGLDDTATEKDITAAYKKLMKKVHPDQDGSQWMSEQLNAARDFLLDQDTKK
jgi:hypothetical protein